MVKLLPTRWQTLIKLLVHAQKLVTATVSASGVNQDIDDQY